jgi:hypothetical protein
MSLHERTDDEQTQTSSGELGDKKTAMAEACIKAPAQRRMQVGFQEHMVSLVAAWIDRAVGLTAINKQQPGEHSRQTSVFQQHGAGMLLQRDGVPQLAGSTHCAFKRPSQRSTTYGELLQALAQFLPAITGQTDSLRRFWACE